MRRFLFLVFLFYNCAAQAQYFDWNKIIFPFSNQVGMAEYNDLRVAPNGNQIINYTVTPCMLCYPEPRECYVDTLGNITGYHNSYWNGYRKSYFDRFGNMMVVTQTGNRYSLKYCLPDTTTIVLHDSVPDYVDGDYAKNIFTFYADGINTQILTYDSTGAFINSMYLPGTIYRMSYAGDIYMCKTNMSNNTATVKRYNSSGAFINNFSVSYFADAGMSPPAYAVSKYSGNVWGVLNSGVVCYDSTGAIVYSIPLIDNSHVSLSVDDNDNLYLWEGNSIYKYSQGALSWQSTIDAALTEKIQADATGNLYYICNYAEPLYDINGIFIPTSYYAPPNVAFKGYDVDPGLGASTNYNVILGRISSAAPFTFNVGITAAIQNDVPVTEFCTHNPFDVRIDYDHLPVNNAQDTIIIEISDSSGSFNNPYIVGQGKGLLIPCEIPDNIIAGNNYRLRVNLGNGTVYSSPYAQTITVKTSPIAPITLENSVEDVFSCQPFLMKTNRGQNLSYSWYYVTDLYGSATYNYFQVNDSEIVLPVNNYEAVGVTLTSTINGCSAASNLFTPFELDSLNPFDIRLLLPDTLYVNDVPVEIVAPGYFQGDISGQGVYSSGTSANNYYFYPDSVTPGLIAIMRKLPHSGTPCIPVEHTQYVYVNALPRNIICGDVGPPNKTLCVGDSVSIPFMFLNPLAYDSTNVYVAELYSEDPDNGKLIKVADLGSGRTSPITAVMPGYRSNRLRFRVRSVETNEESTLNANGEITVPTLPYAQFMDNFLTTNCYPTNVPLNINSSYGEHQWFLNDSLIIDSTDWNVGIIPSKSGQYSLTLTDPGNGCAVKLNAIEVNDSAHIPSLTVDPAYYYLYSCGKSYPVITAQTDALSSISWYFENNLLSSTADSLLTYRQGSYKAVASCSLGCLIAVYEPKYVYTDPLVVLMNSTVPPLCNGESVELSVNDDYTSYAYTYQWVKNNTAVIAQTRQVTVTDSGAYYVVVTSSSGCADSSDVIYINESTVPVPAITPAGPFTLYLGEGIMLSIAANPGDSVQWFNNDVPINRTNKPKYFATHTGAYTALVTNAQGCSNISMPAVVNQTNRYHHIIPSSGKTANDAISKLPVFDVYPNPASDLLNLKGSNIPDENIRIRISDPIGRVMLDKIYAVSAGKLDAAINIESIAAGLYFISIESAESVVSQPLIISRK